MLVPYEERYPYLADRLGHPEFVATPLERLLRLESNLYHPTYTDQPFVQKPSPECDPSLNFEVGDVLYENTRLCEWMKFWFYTGWATWFWTCLYAPYTLVFKSHIAPEWFREGCPYPYFDISPYQMDYFKLSILVVPAWILYTSLWIFRIMDQGLNRYIIKAQYSKGTTQPLHI